MATFQPPPTYAEVGLVDKVTGKVVFNPIWLKWFIDLASVIDTVPAGGGLAGTATNHRVLVGTGGAVDSLGAMTNGQLLIGNTGNDPSVASLTAGSNITITPGAGTIQIDASGGGSGGATTIDSGSLSGTSKSIVIPSSYAYIVVEIVGASSNTATRHPLIQINADTTAANYNTIRIGSVFGEASIAVMVDETAADTFTCLTAIHNYQGTRPLYHGVSIDTAGFIGVVTDSYYTNGPCATIDILWSGTGSFDAGTYAVYGFN